MCLSDNALITPTPSVPRVAEFKAGLGGMPPCYALMGYAPTPSVAIVAEFTAGLGGIPPCYALMGYFSFCQFYPSSAALGTMLTHWALPSLKSSFPFMLSIHKTKMY